ncbi:MAG: GAF domain-containing protein [Chloroflexota bacterium]
MLRQLRQILSAPTFEDEEKNRVAGLLYLVLRFVIGAMFVALPILAFSTTAENVLPLVYVIVPYLIVNIVAYSLMRSGRVQFASYIFIVINGIAIFAAYAVSPQESIGSAIGFLILIAFTTLLLDARAVARLITAIVLFTLIIAVGRVNGWITPIFTQSADAIAEWISTTIVYVLTGVGLILSSQSLYRALTQARTSAHEARKSNQELTELRDALERRVDERTAELTVTSRQNEKRARDLQTINEISQAISTEQNLEKLLPLITDVVSDRFGFYHVGIFLNEPSGQYAVLAAANSAGGQKMLRRQHQLKIGAEGIVGYVTGTGTPRFAIDVGADAVYFNNPDLPETRSEMALPLKVAGKVIGALDVQSTESAAISNEDIATLSILAGQVSIAIENARLYETTRRSLEQTEAAYRQYVQNEWLHLAREERLSGFRYSGGNSAPLESPLDLGEAGRVAEAGNIHQSDADESGKPAQLAIPVKLRGQVIGVLHLTTQHKERWTDDDIDIAESVAEHLGLAIENARLFLTSANRAARERIVSDISSRISGNIHMKNILQVAAQELSQALNGSDVLIQIQPPKQTSEVEE